MVSPEIDVTGQSSLSLDESSCPSCLFHPKSPPARAERHGSLERQPTCPCVQSSPHSFWRSAASPRRTIKIKGGLARITEPICITKPVRIEAAPELPFPGPEDRPVRLPARRAAPGERARRSRLL